jgi:hypothetical protein
MSHADDLQAVSVDEALIDVTTAVEQLQTQTSDDGIPTDPAKQLADAIRDQVRKATGCEGTVTITLSSLLDYLRPPSQHRHRTQYPSCSDRNTSRQARRIAPPPSR